MKFEKISRKRRKKKSKKKELSGIIDSKKGVWLRTASYFALFSLFLLLFLHFRRSVVPEGQLLRETDEVSQQVVRLVTESAVSANDYSNIMLPMRSVVDGVECPNMEGGGKNKQCSRGWSEYHFSVKPGKKYYLYVQTIAPSIWDNSLWIGVNKVEDGSFESCPKLKVGEQTNIPHKHVKHGKSLCCPKYLKKNERKGKDEFYTACCFDGLGQRANEEGCVLDLEVSQNPVWNMMPRIIRPKKNIVAIKLYAREDGTKITNLFLSRNSKLDLNVYESI